MKNNKATGSGGIPSEVYKHGGEILAHHLHDLILKIWNAEEIHQELEDVMIVNIFKTGDMAACGNLCGIFLFSVAGKISSKVQLN